MKSQTIAELEKIIQILAKREISRILNSESKINASKNKAYRFKALSGDQAYLTAVPEAYIENITRSFKSILEKLENILENVRTFFSALQEDHGNSLDIQTGKYMLRGQGESTYAKYSISNYPLNEKKALKELLDKYLPGSSVDFPDHEGPVEISIRF